MKRFHLTAALLALTTPASAQTSSAYTEFDSATCRHAKGDAPEEYGTWTCPGSAGFKVILSAGDQKMSVAFSDGKAGAWQTFPATNDVYKGKVEWRLAGGRPIATILRWNVATQADIDKATGPFTPSGRVLVVSRLGGPSCHIGYVDARANADANELARQIADESARVFRCGVDKPVVRGAVTPGLAMPENAGQKARDSEK
ncbi:hypothetical protein GJ654_04760 [Rhodoblastus acidophilus]|uniref:Uncharacterized protein n=1 Tax=Rhodoblastus acidophilus TaxID=1074 RepID=A0A6N8DM90_RHOAC|nr:hypothetical protein [Rhodoblastus acidophilus]MCW2273615.1 hypothetical protein [Rhodoblastus acidophilus]MTV30301.1 hypothetical protein [Rhodoblastus acidophilus]